MTYLRTVNQRENKKEKGTGTKAHKIQINITGEYVINTLRTVFGRAVGSNTDYHNKYYRFLKITITIRTWNSTEYRK